jgi:hypothetical protein
VDSQSGSLIDDDNRELDAISGPLKSTKMMRKEHISNQESSSRSFPDSDEGGESYRGSDIPNVMGCVGKEIGESVEREGMGEKNHVKVDRHSNSSVSSTIKVEEDSIIKSFEKNDNANSTAAGAEWRLEDESGVRRGEEIRDDVGLNMVFDSCHRSTESTVKGEISYGQDGGMINISVRNNETKNKHNKEEEEEDEDEEEMRGRERVVKCSDEEVKIDVGDVYRITNQTTLKIPLPVDVVSGIIR